MRICQVSKLFIYNLQRYVYSDPHVLTYFIYIRTSLLLRSCVHLFFLMNYIWRNFFIPLLTLSFVYSWSSSSTVNSILDLLLFFG